MRRILLFGLSLVLLPSPSWCQAKPKPSPAVSAFVKEDAAVISLAHVRVVDGTGSAPRVDQTVVIADGKIVALGDSASTKIPDGAKVLDLAGRTVIPGLVGMHDHMFYPAPGGGLPLYPEHASSFPRLYLAGGVTSIRTTGSLEPYAVVQKFTSPVLISKEKALLRCKCTNSRTPKTRARWSNSGSPAALLLSRRT